MYVVTYVRGDHAAYVGISAHGRLTRARPVADPLRLQSRRVQRESPRRAQQRQHTRMPADISRRMVMWLGRCSGTDLICPQNLSLSITAHVLGRAQRTS